jgi:UDP-N-acetylmuramoyl-L-alanyl-D-glutamate--2,6-diaminopimelate ligase
MEPVKLKTLLKDLPVTVKGLKDVEVTGITTNSRQVAPGNLFLAKKGLTHDGSRFIPDAVAAGACAVVTDMYNPFLEITQVITPEVGLIEAVLLNRFYDSPAEKLFLVGITGTNGKTTTSYLVRHLLQNCGLVGTIEWIVGGTILPSTHTTPDLVTLTKLFSDMLTQGCKSAVMEVSSHALDQERVRALPFDVAVFTNLTQDHLDYHQTMENYAAAKAKLFTMLSKEGTAVYNLDCPWHPQVIQNCPAKKISYGFGLGADLRASNLEMTAQAMRFVVHYQNKQIECSSPLIGRFNVYNLLAAIGVGLSYRLSLEAIVQRLSSFQNVRGRLERVPNGRDLNIFVDYSHTDDSLKNALETLRECCKGKLITVFGCGGDRDRTKRPKMGAVAARLSDFSIVTSDNPRSEEPEAIIRDILPGFKECRNFMVEADRKAAIQRAIDMATPEDIVLIAGKGHENYQIFSHQTIHFDDREVAQQAAIC